MREGWEMKKLREVAKATYGYTEKASFEEIGPRFLRITDIQEDGVNWDTVPYCKISSVELEKYKLKSGDIVFARTGATTGKSYLVNNPPNAVFASYLIKVHINDKRLLPDYLFMFFQTRTYWDTINAGVSGSAQGGFNATKLSELEIPIPPVKEQQRIVSILDEAFAAIDQAKENLQRNLQNAKELFQSELNSIFSKIEHDWEIKRLGEVAKEIFAGGDAPLNNYSEIKTEKYKTPIFANAAKNKGLYGYTDLSRVFEPSITIAARGSGTGYTEIRYEPFFPIVRLIVLTPNLEIVTLEFLKYSIKNLDILISGSAIPQLTVPMIKSYSIPLPSLKEQKKIVYQLDTLFEETKKLESLYQQKLNSLEELKKGILQKAFSGELTEKELPA